MSMEQQQQQEIIKLEAEIAALRPIVFEMQKKSMTPNGFMYEQNKYTVKLQEELEKLKSEAAKLRPRVEGPNPHYHTKGWNYGREMGCDTFSDGFWNCCECSDMESQLCSAHCTCNIINVKDINQPKDTNPKAKSDGQPSIVSTAIEREYNQDYWYDSNGDKHYEDEGAECGHSRY